MTCASFVFDVEKFLRLICHCLFVIAAIDRTCDFARCTTQKREHEQQTFYNFVIFTPQAPLIQELGALTLFPAYVSTGTTLADMLLIFILTTLWELLYSWQTLAHFYTRISRFWNLDNIYVRTFSWKKCATHISSYLLETFNNTYQSTDL